MIRFTLRQFRVQSLVSVGALAVVAAVLAVTWPHVSHLADTLPRPALTGTYKTVSSVLNIIVIIVPGLVGVFWGAPLVSRELETGSILVAWTQSVTRPRWLAAKLGVVGLCSLAVCGLFGLMGSLWSDPIDLVSMDRFSPAIFGARGIVPLGYAAFAFALGVTLGVLIRRAQPAMAATLAVFAGVRAAVTYWVRPYLGTAVHETFALNSSDVAVGIFPSEQTVKAFVSMPNTLVRSIRIVDGAGDSITPQAVTEAFPNLGLGQSPDLGWFQAGVDKLASVYHVVVTYQPAGRFWAFQALETALFFVLAFALIAFCFWWMQRRLP